MEKNVLWETLVEVVVCWISGVGLVDVRSHLFVEVCMCAGKVAEMVRSCQAMCDVTRFGH